MRIAALALLCLAGCGRAPAPAVVRDDAGAALERTAIAAGAVADPAALDPAGAYASETDRACLVRTADAMRIGVSVDYGAGQRCLARGTVRGNAKLAIDLGDDCRFEGRFDGARVVFPATVPVACDRACTGRATLGAMTAERLSSSAAEAGAMRAPDDTRALCDN